MGKVFSLCQRRNTNGLDFLGVPQEYEWEGLSDEFIEEYETAKAEAEEELRTKLGEECPPVLPFDQLPRETLERLKGLLLRRALRLVECLKPIEDQRRSMSMMQQKGLLPDGHHESFEQADQICQAELKNIFEESQCIAPDFPPNAVIQSAVRIFHERNAASENEGSGNFEEMKKGFFKDAKKDVKMAHGFPIGAEVEAHSLNTAALNGERGKVQSEQEDRVAVHFSESDKVVKLKPANLRLVPSFPKPHPDAEEVPVIELEIILPREKAEKLGLALAHIPPLDQREEGQPSFLLVNDVLAEGYAKTYNDNQGEPHLRIRKGDRIMAAMDVSVPEAERRPVGGSSEGILEVIGKGSPLLFFVQRAAGPPLRFKKGQTVRANYAQGSWPDGVIQEVWAEQERGIVPYIIRLNENGRIIFAPVDSDEYVVLGDPRFKEGDTAMARVSQGYRKVTVKEVMKAKASISYHLELEDGVKVTAPEDMNLFIRPVARFQKGDKVSANVDQEFTPGVIEAVYHPAWVYAIKLEKTGNVVFAPEDKDAFVKKRE